MSPDLVKVGDGEITIGEFIEGGVFWLWYPTPIGEACEWRHVRQTHIRLQHLQGAQIILGSPFISESNIEGCVGVTSLQPVLG